MKISSIVFGLIAGCTLFAAAGCQSMSSPSASARNLRPVRLQLTVDVPPTMNMIRDDDVAEAFGQTVRAALHERGFKGRIKMIEEGDEPAPGIPVLTVNLLEWRSGPGGLVDCTFGAAIKTPAGSKNLGLFSGTGLTMGGRHDWSARAEGFQSAAGSGLSDLADSLEKTGLISKVPPG
jgi:hypothetical protein